MGLEILKYGQGRYARLVAYGLGAALIAFGGIRFYATFNVPGHAWVENLPIVGDLSPYKVGAFVVVMLGLLGLHVVLNRPSAVDLLIDTEQELKKVSWPSGREVRSATVVVVLVTFAMGLILFGFDWVLHAVFDLVY